MRYMTKSFLAVISLLLVISTVLCCFASCSLTALGDAQSSDSSDVGGVDDEKNKNDEQQNEQQGEQQKEPIETALNYDNVKVEDYVSFVEYEQLSISLDSANASKEEALWNAILENAVISSYPEDKVDYFFNQTKKAYMYIVNGNEEDYKLLLKNRGTDEIKMRDEAKELVKKDLVYYYIVRKENIVLTAEEKTQLFDKYVDEYVNAYRYNREYVIGNMTEFIYESMLYDKTMELLLEKNTFTVDTGKADQ
ncbi:MAG: hypothetical protein J6U86_05600 [Clostridia bacterium]|nr:hypothetical protein [Clostridia bacterium]